MNHRIASVFALWLASCAGGQTAPPERQVPEAVPSAAADVLLTSLDFNVKNKTATAIIDFAELSETSLTLSKGDLQINTIADPNGELKWNARGESLDVGIPAGTTQIRIDYRYITRPRDGGALTTGSTRIWPDHCGNLFPCNSAPGDGSQFRVALSGLTPDEVGVHPRSISTDAPSYMVAWAVGAYEYKKLGTTEAGTEVGTYFTEKGRYPMSSGTRQLVAAFDWLEKTLGPYPFGKKVASVEVDWGKGVNAAMEYHPFWHVSRGALNNPSIHVHEAAHGWFGNGVRIACWEDLVLSEGVSSYLAARALEISRKYVATRLWRDYRNMIRAGNAWPEGCNKIDVRDFGSASVYARGALLFRALETDIGRPELDAALASFYVENRGQAKRFSDLLDHIKAKTEFDPLPCAKAWLRDETPPQGSQGCPSR